MTASSYEFVSNTIGIDGSGTDIDPTNNDDRVTEYIYWPITGVCGTYHETGFYQWPDMLGTGSLCLEGTPGTIVFNTGTATRDRSCFGTEEETTVACHADFIEDIPVCGTSSG